MKTLLLADDSVTIQRVIELTFAHEDVRVVSVSDGRRAVQWMEGEAPDIVLVDVEVPDVDGYAVTAHVKQSPALKHVPVLLLAGAFEPVDQEKARRVGADGVLVKPFEPQQLVSRVRSLLQQSAVVTPFPGVSRLGLTPTFESSGLEPQPLEPPSRPVWDIAAASAGDRPEREPALPSKVSVANAFSALLSPDPPATPGMPVTALPVLSDAAVDEAVRRALVRMTDDVVRRIVVETAERLIRDEIEKIKSNPE